MFGYININQKELSEEEKKIYGGYYCGLCRQLKESCGVKGQMLLNYDMTFMIVLLTGLYELEDEETDFTCALHPMNKRHARINDATRYAADMNVLLTYQNFEDDWKDDHSYSKKTFNRMIQKDYERIRGNYPRQTKAVEQYMKKLEEAERSKEKNVDLIAGLSGEMLGEIFAWREDNWAHELRCLGFYMGKFIYLMDAFEDLEEDAKKNEYNPLANMEKENGQDFNMLCKLILTSMMSECSKSFERMPILLHAGILRNILYSGVWCKYEYIILKRKHREEKQQKRRKS